MTGAEYQEKTLDMLSEILENPAYKITETSDEYHTEYTVYSDQGERIFSVRRQAMKFFSDNSRAPDSFEVYINGEKTDFLNSKAGALYASASLEYTNRAQKERKNEADNRIKKEQNSIFEYLGKYLPGVTPDAERLTLQKFEQKLMDCLQRALKDKNIKITESSSPVAGYKQYEVRNNMGEEIFSIRRQKMRSFIGNTPAPDDYELRIDNKKIEISKQNREGLYYSVEREKSERQRNARAAEEEQKKTEQQNATFGFLGKFLLGRDMK